MFLVAQRVSNSSCNRLFSARWLWRGYDFLCNSLRLPAFAAQGWICPEETGRHVHDQFFCGSERLPPRGHSQGVCREAGATVRCNTKLRDLERLRSWPLVCLPITGAQLAVDITLRSATTAASLLCTNEAHTNGAVLHRTRMEKAAKYSELLEVVADGAARRKTSWT